jgi:NDP-sugar pyrophosphorylase family protein
VKAFLFAAGLGTRLQPYTFETPKPLLKIYDKPIIYYILNYLSNLDVSEVWINTCHLKEQFSDLHIFEKELNVKIHLIEQDELYLHGGDLAYAKDFWASILPDETFIAINADTLFYIDKDEIKSLKSKVSKEAPLLVVGMQSQRDPLRVCNNKLVGINTTFYKPLDPKVKITNGDGFGVYLMHSSIRDYLCKPGEEMGFYDTDGIVGNVIKQDHNIMYYDAVNFMRAEIGNVEDYENYQGNKIIQEIINQLER